MRKERFIIIAALLFIAAPAWAQVHPCDTTPPSPPSVEAARPFTLGACHGLVDQATPPNPTTITGWVLYRNGVIVPGATVTVDATANATGLRYVHVSRTEPAAAAAVVFGLAAVNAQGEGPAFNFPSLSVTPARTAPASPVRGRIVVP